MKNTKQVIALASAAALSVSVLAGCGGAASDATSESTSTATAEASNTAASDGTLVLAETGFEGKFSPFFAASASDQDVIDLTQLGLLGADRKGEMILNGIEGETREYNGTDYTYYGTSDCIVTENDDGTVTYDIKLRDDLKFSDGEPVTIDDVIFSMYVFLDPTYDGSVTMYSTPIVGLEEYRNSMSTLSKLIAEAGEDNTDYTNFTEEQQKAFWDAVNDGGVKFAQEIVDNMMANGATDVASAAAGWGFDGLAADATAKDFFLAIGEQYDWSFSAMEAESAGSALSDLIPEDVYAYSTTGVNVGNAVANVAGIVKTGDYSMTVTLTEVNATAIYQLPVTVCPMHYYGETDKYDYDNNMFGFVKGDLSHVKSVTSTPIGSGPYTFESWSNGAVTLQKNPTYWKGEPKIDTVIWREMTDEDKIPGVVSGTIDVTDPSYSKEAAEQIKEANSNGEISGDTIQTDLVANLGYGYVGFNANRVKVGDGNGGDEASKDLRKAIATVIAVYRDVAVDSYYGEFANVINYPISDTSWAAPRVTDEGYKVAFSVDVNGKPCDCGNIGCLERYCSANAIHERLNEQPSIVPGCEAMTHAQACTALFAKAAAGDKAAMDLTSEVARYIGYGAVNILNAFNPTHIVLGDIISQAGQPLLDEVKKVVRERTIPEVGHDTKITLSNLPTDATVSGAAAVAITNFLEHPSMFFDVA